MSTIPENLVKIGLVISEISLLQAIVKKEEDERSNKSKTQACRLKPGGVIKQQCYMALL